MEYWIIVENRHAGPYSATQLVDAGLDADTLVWHEGLPDWVAASEVEELRLLMDARRREAAAAASRAAHPEVQQPAPMVQNVPIVQQPAQPQPQPQPQPQAAPAWQMPAAQQPAPAAGTPVREMEEPCPPAYIAWSVIVTLLCCTVVGVVAIIFSSQTKSAYYRGDLAKAKRNSEIAQWLIIASIVLGAISWPFQMAVMGMF